jgi:hypothetical protein
LETKEVGGEVRDGRKMPDSGKLSLQGSVDLGSQVSDSFVHSQEKRYPSVIRVSKQPNCPNEHLEAKPASAP